jgi:hypothetical protein
MFVGVSEGLVPMGGERLELASVTAGNPFGIGRSDHGTDIGGSCGGVALTMPIITNFSYIYSDIN